MRNFFLLIVVPFWLASCSTTPVLELPKVQRSLAEKLVSSEDLVQKASTDYREKKALYDNLAKINSPAFKDSDKELGSYLRRMYEHLNEVNGARKEMAEASGDVASLSYHKSEVSADDPQFALLTDATKRFDVAQAELQQSLLDYSRESNSMADLVQAKKLFFTFDVVEFQARIQKTMTGMQEKEKLMQRDLMSAEKIVNEWAKEDSRADLEALFEELKNLTDDYGARAQTLVSNSREMQGLTNSQGKVTSFDPNWAQIQKLISSTDQTISEVAKIEEKFSKAKDKFHKRVKQG
jgi:DNA repair exonuclease SbcCD ATPase subunit